MDFWLIRVSSNRRPWESPLKSTYRLRQEGNQYSVVSMEEGRDRLLFGYILQLMDVSWQWLLLLLFNRKEEFSSASSSSSNVIRNIFIPGLWVEIKMDIWLRVGQGE